MRTHIALVFALLAAPSFVLAAEHTKDTLETIKKATADKTAVLVDVREADEWTAGHVKGATFLPLSELKDANAEAVAKKLPKDKIIYTHCRAGRRSVAAAELLEKITGTEVYAEISKRTYAAAKARADSRQVLNR